MKNSFKITLSLLIFLFILSCSTKKDAFLNRRYHSISTKYNVLYNGKEALRLGLEQLNSNYTDNYWERLPIEPLKIDVLAIPGMEPDEDNSPKEFEKAEEKAVKAVQMHSMVIARRERNKQIDEAYLLLGKARYYSKRFVPALEAFNHILLNYPNSDLYNETIVWQSKTQIRLQNEEQAIQNLKFLLKDKNLDEKNKEDAHTAIAMAYVVTDSIQQVINHLNKAVKTSNNKEQTARNLFVLGQLYSENKLKDSSNYAFKKVIEFKKAPYKYKIHAHIEKAKNASNKEEVFETVEVLNKLIKDRDNRPYLDKLYYQLGVIEKENNVDKAVADFKKALRSSSKINLQKELAYQALGDIYFDKAQFISAGAYYDSILQITKSDNSKRVRSLKRKRDNLSEVIYYENILKTNDSILSLVSMSDDERTTFFTSHIEKLKKAAEKQQQKVNTGTGFNIFSKTDKQPTSAGKWYFYNVQTVGFGEQEFKRIWGNRPLEDNWRLSDKTQLDFGGKKVSDVLADAQVDDLKKYDVSYYLNLIPKQESQIDSLKKARNEAYYKLGVIYKEQFKELDLAAGKLEKLLTFNPVENIKVPATYHLYKIYEAQNNTKAATLRNSIVTNYPNSKYAKIILNPAQFVAEENEASPEKAYAEVFYEYKEEKFNNVIEKSNAAISKYEGLQIVPKFELLKAYAIGKKEGILAFKDALEFVAMNYPNTIEGKKALEVLETLKNKI